MKLKEITYSLSYTIPRPDKDYASFKPMLSASAELQEDETLTEAADKLKELVTFKLDQIAKELFLKFNKNV